MENNFMGKEGQEIPIMPEAFIDKVTSRYIELYELLTEEKFQKCNLDSISKDIEESVLGFLAN